MQKTKNSTKGITFTPIEKSTHKEFLNMKTINKLTFAISLALSISFGSCQQNNGKGGKVSVDEFETLLNKTSDAQIIDVRTAEEYNGGHLKNAKNIDANSADFSTQITGLDKSKPVFVYCLSGGRSSSAANEMRKAGFTTVYEMPGMLAWNNAAKEVVTDLPTGENAAAAPTGLSLEAYMQKVNSPKYVLVDFNATWCKPCKQLAPILEKISKDKADKLTFIAIDSDENPELCQAKNIESIPFLELYKDGKLVWEHKGFITEEDLLKATGL